MKMRGLFPMVAAGFMAAPVLAAPSSTGGGAASAAASPTWSAWFGCWYPLGEAGTPGAMVCVLPGEDAASVRIVTLQDGVMSDETLLRADGVARRVEEGGCVGTERADWSRDGRRVYLRTDLVCDGVKRQSTGVLAMLSESAWLDAQAMTVGDQHASRAIKYRAALGSDIPAEIAALLPPHRELAQETTRLHAAAPLDIDAVIEASQAVAPPVLEALLAARGHAYALDAGTLIRLEDAGVSPSVLDMMIAVSYPKKFVIESADRDARPERVPPVARYREDCLDPFYYPSMRYRPECAYLYGMSRYGFGFRYGYSPWGYDRFGWGYGYSPVIIVPSPSPATERARVVRGQGYRQGGSDQTGTAQPRSARSRESSSRSPSATPSSSTTPSTPTTSSGSTSSGSDSGRTARPRGSGDP
jgi:hypothetical protein